MNEFSKLTTDGACVKPAVANRNLFVITGGPGSGKTTVLLELARRGYQCAPEVARQIIQEQVQNGGKALPWNDHELFTALMLDRSIESFLAHTPSPAVIFADRGIPDTLGYARLIGLSPDDAIRQACQTYRYSRRIFLAPPWEEIYETDTERKQDFAEAVHTYKVLSAVYRECRYELLELPKLSPRERADFILHHLE